MKAKFDTGVILSNKIPKVLIFVGISFLFYVFNFGCLAFLFLMITLFLGYIYRNPERYIYREEQQILSPVDGIVDAIDGNKIFVYSSVCDASVIRMPQDGKFIVSFERNGSNVTPFMPKAKKLNETIIVQFENLKLQFIGGLFGEKIDIYNRSFKLSKGDRIGSFVNGLVEMTLDENLVPSVKLGQYIKAGETAICEEIKG